MELLSSYLEECGGALQQRFDLTIWNFPTLFNESIVHLFVSIYLHTFAGTQERDPKARTFVVR